MRTFIGITLLLLTTGASLADDSLTYHTFQQPCRIIDTRLSSAGILVSGDPRSFKVAGISDFVAQGGTNGGCGVPEEAFAVQINFVAVNPLGGGNFRGAAFPSAVPTTGSILNYQLLSPVLNIANGLQFPICDHFGAPVCAFDITVQANGAGAHLVADVLGYYLADHKHDGEDITGGTIAASWIDGAIARDSEIFPTVLANDGSGSTLDADLLDGADSSSFAPVSHSHAGLVYQRTVVVASGGTPTQNGTALLGAMASITTNSETNMYLLKIEPGIFDLGTAALVMKEWVDIEGSGELATIIRRSTPPGACFSGNGTIRGINNAELRQLTAENTGGGNCSIALEIIGTSPRVTHVTLRASGGTQQNEGADVISGLPVFVDVQMIATGGTIYTAALWNTGGASTLIGVRATASGATVNIGVMNAAGSGTTRIYNSIIDGTTNSVRNGGGSLLIGNSQLAGGPADQVAGTIRCYGVYDENFQNAGGLTSCP